VRFILNDCLLCYKKISVNNQGPYRVATAIVATESELLQKFEFSPKEPFFQLKKTLKHVE
jgi:hypothetical protein